TKALEMQRGAVKADAKITFADALTKWTQYQILTHERVSASETDRFIRYNCENLLTRRLSWIEEPQVIRVLERKMNAGRKAAANRLYAHLKSFFKWARKRKFIAVDPMLDVEKPWQGKAA